MVITEEIMETTNSTSSAQTVDLNCDIIDYAIGHLCANYPNIADMYDQLVGNGEMTSAELFGALTEYYNINLVNDDYVSAVTIGNRVCYRDERPDGCDTIVIRAW